MTGLFYFKDTLVGSLSPLWPGPARSEYLSSCVHQRLKLLPVFVHIITRMMVSPVVQYLYKSALYYLGRALEKLSSSIACIA